MSDLTDAEMLPVTPLVCPFCGWFGTDDGVKVEWETNPVGVKINDTRWTCPKCGVVIHSEDEGEKGGAA